MNETPLRLATWNVNSIKARLDHVTGWLQTAAPDVLMLQELKGLEFPAAAFEALGYASVAVTQKTYNGVAILSRAPIQNVITTLAGDEQDSHARYLETMIGGVRVVNVHMPNGNPIGTDKFAYKLAWMDRMRAQMDRWLAEGTPTMIGGDFNVIPEDIDCDKPANWTRDALFQPEPRARYRAMLAAGYIDAFRALHPGEGGHFTYWDYFRQAFERNRGIRIDHFLLSPQLSPRLLSCEIDRTPRALEKPSDHTPIVVTLRPCRAADRTRARRFDTLPLSACPPNPTHLQAPRMPLPRSSSSSTSSPKVRPKSFPLPTRAHRMPFAHAWRRLVVPGFRCASRPASTPPRRTCTWVIPC